MLYLDNFTLNCNEIGQEVRKLEFWFGTVVNKV